MTDININRPPLPPLPPFTEEEAQLKVRLAENAWNTQQPQKISMAYSEDSQWRNRNVFLKGRSDIVNFLTEKWKREKEYRLVKELWAFQGNRIAVRFAYEYHDRKGQWFRAYGNENWEFDAQGFMRARHASINELEISEDQRLFHWPLGIRPDDTPELSEY